MKILILLLLLAGSLAAQATVETNPDYIPSSATDLVTVTVRVFQMSLVNESSSDVICSIADRQASPKPLLAPVKAIGAGTSVLFAYPSGRIAPNGLRWSCNVGGVVNATITYKQ